MVDLENHALGRTGDSDLIVPTVPPKLSELDFALLVWFCTHVFFLLKKFHELFIFFLHLRVVEL